jgi:hypothetical protein
MFEKMMRFLDQYIGPAEPGPDARSMDDMDKMDGMD